MLGSWHSGLPKPPFKEGPAAPLIGAVAGAAASSYISATAIGLATTVGGFSIAGALAGAVVSSVVSGALADDPAQPDFGANSAASGMLVNKAANDAPIPVVYGRRTVGGTRVLMEVTGTKNEYLHIVLVLSEGEIDSVEDVYLNDVSIEDDRFTAKVYTGSCDAGGPIGGALCALVDAGAIAVGTPSTENLVFVSHNTGADDQTADPTMVSDIPQWTETHRLQGTAYLYARLKFDQDAFASGLPIITADVKGKKVYDPRTSTTAWSDNPALCIRDYLTNTRYGRGIDASLIDDTAFNAAANYCEEQVTIGGETKDRYTLNGVVDTSQGSMDVLKKLLTACRGFLVFSGGKYKLIIDKPETAAFTFSEDNIVGAWSISLGDKNNQFNRIRANFFNPDRQWQPDIAVVDSPTLRTDDNGLLLEKTIDLPFTSDIDRAKMITTINLNQSRQQITCEFTATIEGLRCEVGDVVYIKHTTPGWETLNSNQGKLFRIMRLTIQNNDEVRVLALEYDATAYDFGTIAASDAAPNTNLPDLAVVVAPTGLTFTENPFALIGAGTFSWTASADIFVDQYELDIVADAYVEGSRYENQRISFNQRLITRDTSISLNYIPTGPYTVTVKAVNTMGASSSTISLSFFMDAPSIPNIVSGIEINNAGIAVIGTILGDEDYEFGANTTVWTGTDCKIRWREGSVNAYELNDEEPFGIEDGGLDSYLKGFVVEVYSSASTLDSAGNALGQEYLLRSEITNNTHYTYTKDKNHDDHVALRAKIGGLIPRAKRDLTFRVKTLALGNRVSKQAAILRDITNEKPTVPSDLTVTPSFGGCVIEFTPPNDGDFAGVYVWAGLSSEWDTYGWANTPFTTEGYSTRVYKGSDSRIEIPLLPEKDYKLQIAFYDDFGADIDEIKNNGTYSSVYEVKSTQLPDKYYVAVDGFTASGTEVAIPEITSASLATKAKGTWTTDSWASDTVTGLVQTPLDMDSANAWDSEEGTDYSQAANRASGTFYMHFVGNNRHVPFTYNLTGVRSSGGQWWLLSCAGPLGEEATTYAELKTYVESQWSGTTITTMKILDDNNPSGFPSTSDPEFIDVTSSTDEINYGKGIWVLSTGGGGVETTTLTFSGHIKPLEWEVFPVWSLIAMPVVAPYLGETDRIDDFEATLPFDLESMWTSDISAGFATWVKGVPENLNTLHSIESGAPYYLHGGGFDIEQRYIWNHPELRHVFSPNEDILQTRLTRSSFSGSNISISGTTATVTDTGHGAMTGDKVELTGFTAPTNAKDSEFNSIHSITRVDNDTYTFSISAGTGAASGTGTIKHSHSDSIRVAKITTDSNGDIDTIITYRSGI